MECENCSIAAKTDFKNKAKFAKNHSYKWNNESMKSPLSVELLQMCSSWWIQLRSKWNGLSAGYLLALLGLTRITENNVAENWAKSNFSFLGRKTDDPKFPPLRAEHSRPWANRGAEVYHISIYYVLTRETTIEHSNLAAVDLWWIVIWYTLEKYIIYRPFKYLVTHLVIYAREIHHIIP